MTLSGGQTTRGCAEEGKTAACEAVAATSNIKSGFICRTEGHTSNTADECECDPNAKDNGALAAAGGGVAAALSVAVAVAAWANGFA